MTQHPETANASNNQSSLMSNEEMDSGIRLSTQTGQTKPSFEMVNRDTDHYATFTTPPQQHLNKTGQDRNLHLPPPLLKSSKKRRIERAKTIESKLYHTLDIGRVFDEISEYENHSGGTNCLLPVSNLRPRTYLNDLSHDFEKSKESRCFHEARLDEESYRDQKENR